MTDRLLYDIWFAEAMGYGSRKAPVMLEEEPNSFLIYQMGPEEYRYFFSVDLTEKEIAALCRKDLTEAQRILSFCEEKHVDILTLQDENYPRKLRNIINPPVVLYTYGKMPDVDERLCISLVGSRSATAYGCNLTFQLSAALAKCGVVVVSGMARGIDTMANSGALYGGGETIAVIGCGINIAYPKENRELMKRISRQGVIISEFPPDSRPEAWHFPIRNRIICALSEGTVVVEAHKSSGSLITAKLALEQGKDVFAVPGNVGDYISEGSNNLIKLGGAKLITSAADILAEYSGRITLTPKQEHALRRVPVGRALNEEDLAAVPASALPPEPPQPPRPKVPRRAPVKKVEPPKVKQPAVANVPVAILDGLDEQSTKLCEALQQRAMTKDQLAEHTGIPVWEISSRLTMLEMEGLVQQQPGQTYVWMTQNR